SKSPKPLGRNDPVGSDCRGGVLLQSSQLALPLAAARPHQNCELVPARAAYSHSASLGSRYPFFVFCESQVTKALASSHLTSMTGRLPRPHPWSSGGYLHPPEPTKRPHSSKVISRRPIANGLAITPRCWGF